MNMFPTHMKPNSFVRVALMALSALIAWIPSARGGNLLPEGSMEIPGDQGLAEGFHYPDPNWLKGFGAAVTVENENGNRFIRVNMPQPEQLIACTFEIPVPEGASSLRVTWRVRATVRQLPTGDEPGGSGVCLIASWYTAPRGPGERGYKFGGMQSVKESTNGWVNKESILPVPPGKKFISFQFGTKSVAATADFDDIVIEKFP